jgi:hypothetical protein
LLALGLEQATGTLHKVRGTDHPMACFGRQAIQPGEPLFAAQEVVIEDQRVHVTGQL